MGLGAGKRLITFLFYSYDFAPVGKGGTHRTIADIAPLVLLVAVVVVGEEFGGAVLDIFCYELEVAKPTKHVPLDSSLGVALDVDINFNR